jgi:hypothetical protein
VPLRLVGSEMCIRDRAYGGPATSARGNVLQTARGERRWFRTLDTAHDFIRECGFRGAILLEERFIPRDENTGP